MSESTKTLECRRRVNREAFCDRLPYVRDYTSERKHRAALADFLNYYNHERPHTALGGWPPVSRATGSDYRIEFERPPEPINTAPQQLTFDDVVESTC
ncbi:integrase core domain-containing protein [Streptomyces sp. NBC_01288]|uniref:integrase core domain-containing protein n=1 Tax=Streptomyces sp. NBC_01288 TaxID=2903814 RepID=UPI003FA34A52